LSSGFGGWFRKQCDKAGHKHCSAHGLRKAGASIAAENGTSPHRLGFLVRRETNDERIFPTSDPGDFPTDLFHWEISLFGAP
jgi:hypothetical protein